MIKIADINYLLYEDHSNLCMLFKLVTHLLLTIHLSRVSKVSSHEIEKVIESVLCI